MVSRSASTAQLNIIKNHNQTIFKESNEVNSEKKCNIVKTKTFSLSTVHVSQETSSTKFQSEKHLVTQRLTLDLQSVDLKQVLSTTSSLSETENIHMTQYFQNTYTPNANMVDHSAGAWDELHEREASEATVFCFDKVLVVLDFRRSVCFFSLCLRNAVFLNATRSDRSVHYLPLSQKVDQCKSLRRKKGVHDRRRNY